MILGKDRDESRTLDTVAPGHIRYCGREIAIGLLWQPVITTSNLRDQAVAAAGGTGVYDLHVKTPGNQQYGLTSSSGNHSSGMLAGALQVETENLGENWIAAFALADGIGPMWVVAVRNNCIYEDSFHESPVTAHRSFMQIVDAPDWETVIAPSVWKVDNSTQQALQDLFRLDTRATLRSINRVSRLLPWVLISAVAGIGCAVVLNQAPRLLELATSKEVAGVEMHSVTVQPPPWHGKPHLLEFADHCIQKIGSAYILLTGWEALPVTCGWREGEFQISARWNRKGGSIDLLKLRAAERFAETLELDCHGDCASLQASMSMPEHVLQTGDESWAANMTELPLKERFLELGLELEMTMRGPRMASNVVSDAPGVQYSHHDLGLEANAAIAEHIALLADVPALVPEALTYNPASGYWLFTARVYHRNEIV